MHLSDNVVAAAKANGIRLIVALTNNWSDYGGMDVYVKQLLGSANHDLFYTDATVKVYIIGISIALMLNSPSFSLGCLQELHQSVRQPIC